MVYIVNGVQLGAIKYLIDMAKKTKTNKELKKVYHEKLKAYIAKQSNEKK